MTKLWRSRCLVLAVCASLISALAAQPGERVFELALTDGKLPQAMQVIRIKQGDSVKLRWTTDRAITLHLHGYDIERELKAGAVTEFSFKAHATGRFPVNAHEHGRGERVVLYLEVHPR